MCKGTLCAGLRPTPVLLLLVLLLVLLLPLLLLKACHPVPCEQLESAGPPRQEPEGADTCQVCGDTGSASKGCPGVSSRQRELGVLAFCVCGGGGGAASPLCSVPDHGRNDSFPSPA
jgi:hypothetical protein